MIELTKFMEIKMLEQASIIREKRKNIRITVNREGNIVVYCPFGISYQQIETLLKSKQKLLEKHSNRIKTINSKFSKIINMETILLFGKEYYIVPTIKVNKPSFTNNYFLIPKKINENGKTAYYIKKVIKEISERIIVKRINDIIKAYNFDVSKVIIGSFKSKWGSCDNFNVIKLNWKLAMLDTKIIDFVIFHELTHIKELNHSKKFYNELSKICPDWKETRESLKNYSFLLNLY